MELSKVLLCEESLKASCGSGLLFRGQKGDVRVKEGQKREGGKVRLSLLFSMQGSLSLICLVALCPVSRCRPCTGWSLPLWTTSLCTQFSSLQHLPSSFIMMCLCVCFSSWVVSSMRHKPSFILLTFCLECLFLE